MNKKYFSKLLIFTVVLSTIFFLLFSFVIPQFYLNVFPWLILFFITSTFAVHYILTKAGNQKITKFSTFFMASTTAKLFLYLIFIVLYVLLDKENAVIFLITFFILYLLYTFFETFSLLNDLKEEN
ncbi:MAG: hypothetical protein JXR51_05890 [Bacteroidales bacterium]|nr:hypothetical protein [Bacteroidales bacterium]MBN2756692.1 hypothetical protein [Bacteroidales bacterium]